MGHDALMRLWLCLLCLSLSLAACTQRNGMAPLAEHAQDQWKALKEYDAYPLLEATGFPAYFPSRFDRTRTAVVGACHGQEAERRVVTFGGASEAYTYTQCPYTPYFPELPVSRIQ